MRSAQNRLSFCCLVLFRVCFLCLCCFEASKIRTLRRNCFRFYCTFIAFGSRVAKATNKLASNATDSAQMQTQAAQRQTQHFWRNNSRKSAKGKNWARVEFARHLRHSREFGLQSHCCCSLQERGAQKQSSQKLSRKRKSANLICDCNLHSPRGKQKRNRRLTSACLRSCVTCEFRSSFNVELNSNSIWIEIRNSQIDG